MKKISIISIALLALVGCAKENKTIKEETSLKQITVRVSNDLTKANWLDNKGFLWDSGSDATLFGIVTNAQNFAAGTSMEVSEDDGTGILTATVSASEGDKLLLYYPYEDWLTAPDMSSTGATLTFSMRESQTQYEAGSQWWLADKMILVSSAPLTYGEDLSTSMSCLTSLARFLVYSSGSDTENVKSIVFSAKSSTQPLNGTVTATVDYSGNVSLNAANGSNTIALTMENPYDISEATDAKSSKGAYIGLCPATVTGFNITVKTDVATYYFESDGSIEFKAAEIKNIMLNLDKATSVDDGTAKTTSIWEGSQTYSDWETKITVATAVFNEYEAGGHLTFYFTPTDGVDWCSLIPEDGAWNKLSLGDINPGTGENVFVQELTADDATALNTNGLMVFGYNLTLTNVTYTPPVLIKTVSEESVTFGDWAAYLTVSSFDWSDISEEAVITTFVTRDTETADAWWSVQYGHMGDGWPTLTSGAATGFSNGESHSIILTADDITNLTSYGLVVSGSYVTTRKVTVHNK